MMGTQAQAFLNGEGQAWLKRNEHKLNLTDDPVLDSIKANLLHPKTVLEIGCANGWRLVELEKQYQCQCLGIDPAVTSSPPNSKVVLHRGTADDLWSFKDGSIDLLIYGFCLYLCDPQDYFTIAREGDRVLADGGYLVIYDFDMRTAIGPYACHYKHKPGLLSYHMRWETLWAWHPAYCVQSVHLTGEGDDATQVTLLKKDMHNAFPVRKI
jgi:ubiquinone/menaquinone biosynthesis C-methylase UbiE